MNSLTFGVGVSTAAAPDADPIGEALAAERLGFDFVSASDHPSGNDPTYETWTLHTWIAAATTRIAVATRVLSVPFRSPAPSRTSTAGPTVRYCPQRRAR